MIHLLYFYCIVLYFTRNSRSDDCRPRLYLLTSGDLHRFSLDLLFKLLIDHSKNTVLRISGNLSPAGLRTIVDHPRKKPRLSRLSLFHSHNLSCVESACLYFHQFSRITVAYPMAQGSEMSVGIHISDSTDPLGIIPDPGPQLIASVLSLYRRQGYLHVFSSAPYGKTCFSPVPLPHFPDRILLG